MEVTMDVEAQVERRNDGNNSLSVFRKANLPVTLKFNNVVYEIKPNNSSGMFSKNKAQEGKTILKGITGVVKPGEMLAMLGPSGSGKTTLLTALGGRLRMGKVTGDILYNDKPFSNGMKRNTGFVTQDDVLFPHLTVTETLVFTALLRLPNTMTSREKAKQAEEVVSLLGLARCKDSIIGGALVRGVSGGERKRVSIGQEILINPSLLFLDEPTSGLDATTAQTIVSTLWELAQGGRSLLMTIHQPSSRLFYMFDKILILSEGNPLYFGRGSGAMDYFASVGFSPSVPMNPSDFLLDIANGISPDESQKKDNVKEILVAAYKVNLLDDVRQQVQEPVEVKAMDSEERKTFGEFPTTPWQQFCVLLKRGLKERRHESFSGLKVGQVIITALLVGCLWFQSDIANLQDQLGVLFFFSNFWGFFPLYNAIFAFPQERRMLDKERSSGMYRLSSYFMSAVIGDLPMELVLPIVFLIIAYFMAGLNPDPARFFVSLCILLLLVLASSGLGYAIGALVMDLKSAVTLGSVIMLAFVLIGGFYVENVPAFIAWVKYLSMGNYAYKLLVIAQYKPTDTYPCGADKKSVCNVGDFGPIKSLGLSGLGTSLVAMFIFIIGYRVIAYIALMRVGRTKQ